MAVLSGSCFSRTSAGSFRDPPRILQVQGTWSGAGVRVRVSQVQRIFGINTQ